MKSKIRTSIILILILALLGFLSVKLFYHSKPLIGKATLSWDRSDDRSVTGYKVYWGTERRNNDCPPGGYAKNLDVGNVNSYVIDQLENGQMYYFSVTSYNASQKESCFSKEMQKEIKFSKLEYLKNFLNNWRK